MPRVYKDRGIIKWHPFDALVGYSSFIKEMNYRRGQIKKPIISEDDYNELNYKLKVAFEYKQELEIKYYEDGYLKNTYGTISKLDFLKKNIFLSTGEIVNATNILNIELIF